MKPETHLSSSLKTIVLIILTLCQGAFAVSTLSDIHLGNGQFSNSNTNVPPKKTLLNFYVTESDIYLNELHLCTVKEMLEIENFHNVSYSKESRLSDPDFGQISYTIKYKVRDLIDSLCFVNQLDTIREPLFLPFHRPRGSSYYIPFHEIKDGHPLREVSIFAPKTMVTKVVNNIITLSKVCGVLEFHLIQNRRYVNEATSHTLQYNPTKGHVKRVAIKKPQLNRRTQKSRYVNRRIVLTMRRLSFHLTPKYKDKESQNKDSVTLRWSFRRDGTYRKCRIVKSTIKDPEIRSEIVKLAETVTFDPEKVHVRSFKRSFTF